VPFLSWFRRSLSHVIGRAPVHRDLDEEVGGYFDMLVDEHVSRGLDDREARRLARLEMGGVDQVKEAVRALRPGAWVETVVRDVRHSFRTLLRTPGFSLTAVLVLALAIGANAAVFTLIDIVLFRPLAGGAQPGTVIGIYSHDPSRADSFRSVTYEDYAAIRNQSGVLVSSAAYRTSWVGVTDGSETAQRREAALVTGEYFETLGVRVSAGRGFTDDELRPGSRAAVVVLSDAYWRGRAGGRDMLGRTITLNTGPFTVIGIAPRGFAGPLAFGGPDFWMPLGARELLAARGASRPDMAAPGGAGPRDAVAAKAAGSARDLQVIGRLAPGMTVETADAAVRTWSRRLPVSDSPGESKRVLTAAALSRTADSDQPADDSEVVMPLGTLMAAAILLLVIASLNVANMQLARGMSRRKEIAMRLALGAGRGRIAGQLFIEALLLALAGGGLGVAGGAWTVDAVVAALAAIVPQSLAVDVTPDWRVWLASFACCLIAAVAFGLGPAWRLSRIDLVPELKVTDAAGGRGARWFGPRNLLVAGQVALSLALLAASGLFVRGALAASRADPGYGFDRQLLVRVDASLGRHDERSGRQAYREAMARVRSMPGVDSASIASVVAFGFGSDRRSVTQPGTPPATDGGAASGTTSQTYAVGAAYFQTLGLPMLRGREFTAAEELEATAPGVAIIDEPLAAALFAGQDPVGRMVQLDGPPERERPEPMTVVGVVPGLRHRLTDRAPVPHVYLPLGAHYRHLLYVHVRMAPAAPFDTGDVRRTLNRAVRSADSRLAVLGVETLEEARDGTPRNWIVRAAGRAFGTFGGIALFMAAIGLYGVKAYLVACRTREVGIRIALGASAADVVRMVLGEGVRLLAGAVAVGFLLAMAAGQVVSSLLVGVDAFDPLVLSAATLVLVGAVLAACYVPARRATRVSPVIALRTE